MKKIEIDIKRVNLKRLWYSFTLSLFSVFLIFHLGQFKYNSWIAGRIDYINEILSIDNSTKFATANPEYLDKLKYFFKILLEAESVLAILIFSLIYFVTSIVYSNVRVKVNFK